MGSNFTDVRYQPLQAQRSRASLPRVRVSTVEGDDVRRNCSRDLSNLELRELCYARGHMPPITFSKPAASPEDDVASRVQSLDEELGARVQALCDRLCLTTKRSGVALQCWQCAGSCKRYVKLGVVGEILPHICFFVVYSLMVTYYVSHLEDWDLRWSASKQDAIYYPAVVLAFLLCFRASGCMDRYKEGLRATFEMEKCLREVSFEVMTKLAVAGADEMNGRQEGPRGAVSSSSLRKKYFKHEFRRLVRLLFACAARDLNDSALEESELGEQEAERITCAMTEVEHAAVLVTHSANGHAFRVYLAAAWLQKLVRGVAEEGLFDDDSVAMSTDQKLGAFKSAWLEARQVAYSSMPPSVTHILWLLTTGMSLFMPWEWVSICRWSTWFPSVLLTISFYGILQIADSMENPFGFDDDDIPIWEVAEHLDEEICLTMYYAVLDEFGGENLYRSLMGNDMIFLEGFPEKDPEHEEKL